MQALEVWNEMSFFKVSPPENVRRTLPTSLFIYKACNKLQLMDGHSCVMEQKRRGSLAYKGICAYYGYTSVLQYIRESGLVYIHTDKLLDVESCY